MAGILNADTNLRTGPGTEYKARCLVDKNRGVEILDARSERDWAKVRVTQGRYAGLVGWMYKDNIDRDR